MSLQVKEYEDLVKELKNQASTLAKIKGAEDVEGSFTESELQAIRKFHALSTREWETLHLLG